MTKRTRRTLIAAAGFGFALAIGVLAWRGADRASTGQATRPPHDAPSRVPDAVTAVPSHAVPASAKSSRASIETASPAESTRTATSQPANGLPPFDARIADYHAELLVRARAGDDVAACRLGLELNACRQLPNLRRMLALTERDAAVEDEQSVQATASSQQAASLAATIAAREQRCDGVSSAWFEEAPALVLQAARRDDRVAAHYALSPPMDGHDFLRHLDAWQTYGREAPALLARAAEHGNLAAMAAMRDAYQGESVLFGLREPFPRDPYRAAVYGVIIGEHASGWQARAIASDNLDLRRELGDARYAAAVQEGERLARRQPVSPTAPIDAQTGGWLPRNPEQDCGRD